MSTSFNEPPGDQDRPAAAGPQGPAAAQGPSGPRASFGQRLIAALVDTIILAVIGVVIRALFSPGVEGVVNLVLGAAYYIYLEGSPAGQTVGKKLVNIRVIDFNSGGSIDYGRAAIRYVARILSALPCLLGFFWMLWDREKQTWHDKLSTTVVVPTSSYPVSNWP